MYPENKMKHKMRNGEVVLGMMCNSGNPTMVEMLGYAGFDYVVIETEHTPISLDDSAMHLIRAAEIGGLTPLVRVRGPDPGTINKALDMGSQGIFVTHVNSREEAERVVEAVKYPPIGGRGSGPGRYLGRHRYSLDRRRYINYWNEESVVLFLVESAEGVDDLEEIVSVPGIDAMGIGQGDLSVELGEPAPRFGSPEVVKAVEKLISLCRPRGIAVRDIFGDAETAVKWYEKGVRVFEWGFDLEVFQKAARGIVKDAQALKKL